MPSARLVSLKYVCVYLLKNFNRFSLKFVEQLQAHPAVLSVVRYTSFFIPFTAITVVCSGKCYF